MAIASPIDWQTVENAIYDWLSSATGLTTVWGEQDSPQPSYPYASMRIISGPTRVAGLDEHRYSYDELQPLGEEIGIETCGPREMTLSVQIHAKQADVGPTDSPRNLMSRAQSSLATPSVLAALRIAGLSVVDEGQVLNANVVVEDTWIARAMMDVRFGLAASVVERTGYIATVGVEPKYYKPDGVTELDDDLQAPFDISIP